MKQASPSNCTDGEKADSKIQGNGPTTDDLGTSVDKLEDIRWGNYSVFEYKIESDPAM